MGYYFEVWLRGFAKDHLRKISGRDNETYHPHITFVRPFEIRTSEEKVKRSVISFCQDKSPIFFILESQGNFGEDVVYVPVKESDELLEFNGGLEQVIGRHVEFVEKLNDEKVLHVTIGFDGKIKIYPQSERIEQYMLRMTAIRDKKIWFSYDFVTQEVLSRGESLDKPRWYSTVHQFTEQFGLLPTRTGYQIIKKTD